MDTNSPVISRRLQKPAPIGTDSGLVKAIKAIKAIDSLDYLGQNRTFYREEMLTGNVMVEDVLKTFLFS
jgi:hypothetical protein